MPGGDCQCADGSEFSFWSREGDPEKVVLFFQGGGACFTAEMCSFTDGTYTVQADGSQVTLGSAGVFDAANEANPFRDYSFVFVPYCTGRHPPRRRRPRLRRRPDRQPRRLRQRLGRPGLRRGELPGRLRGVRHRLQRRRRALADVRRPGLRRPARRRHRLPVRRLRRLPQLARHQRRHRQPVGHVRQRARLARERGPDPGGLGRAHPLRPGRPARPRHPLRPLRRRLRRGPAGVLGRRRLRR